MESIEEFMGIDVVNGGLFICKGDTVSSVKIVSSLLFSFFGWSFDMGVRFDVGWDRA
jgi:hypothetical protein